MANVSGAQRSKVAPASGKKKSGAKYTRCACKRFARAFGAKETIGNTGEITRSYLSDLIYLVCTPAARLETASRPLSSTASRAKFKGAQLFERASHAN
jgi:hypothetical protein